MSHARGSRNSIVDSAAFERETLKSERIRILAILSVLAVITAYSLARALMLGGEGELGTCFRILVLLALMAAYEAGMLGAVRRAIRDGRSLPGRTWILNVIIETLLPTAGLFVLTESSLYGPYAALGAPVVLTYFFFITLSTLRLSPKLAVVTGISSAVGYALVLTYTLVRYPDPPAGSMELGRGVYLTYAVCLLIGGWIAAGVARQIRSHVTSALEEALQNERVARDLEVARSIQQGLLPKSPPEIPGFDVAGWSRPADETGGDFYYWQPLANGCTGIALADVTGHGIGPAIIASVARAYGRACLTEDAEIGNVVSRIDALLGEDLPPGKLVNLITSLVDPGGGRVHVLSAGQGPLVLFRAATDTIESFNAHGVPLGVGVPYGAAQEFELAPGDMLVLFTDGIFEWENADGEQFGLERLTETIRGSSGRSSEEVIAAMHAAAQRFVDGAPQQDDLTAVVIKRTAPSATT